MSDKGTCQKHGEFILAEGCHQCLADKMGKEGNTEASIAEAARAAGCVKCLAEKVTVKIKVTAPEGFLEGEEEEVRDEIVKLVETIAEIQGASKPEVITPETAVALRPGEDIEARGWHTEALGLLKHAEDRVIATVEDVKEATDDLSLISKLKKAMDGKRKEYLVPLKVEADAIRETYSSLMDPVFRADRITRDKMLAYQQEQERIRQEQERINALRLEAAQKEMELKGEITESVDLVEVAPEAPKRVSTDLGTAGLTDCWKYEVFDFTLLPDTYKVADTAMLNTIAKKHHDLKQIPGVRFYNEPGITMRAR